MLSDKIRLKQKEMARQQIISGRVYFLLLLLGKKFLRTAIKSVRLRWVSIAVVADLKLFCVAFSQLTANFVLANRE